jgi:SAM-dependent methyltransferase
LWKRRTLARALTKYLAPDGRYEGLDVHAGSVEWLTENYKPYPNFGFTHADVYNKMYNPAGKCQPRDYLFLFLDHTFDVVLLKSVFTHMVPPDVRHYLAEISRVLKRGGRSIATYFLLNLESRRFLDARLDKMSLHYDYMGDPSCLVANLDVPEHVVAHDEARIRGCYGEAGLAVCDVTFGDWCGRPSLVGLQDLIIAVKK